MKFLLFGFVLVAALTPIAGAEETGDKEEGYLYERPMIEFDTPEIERAGWEVETETTTEFPGAEEPRMREEMGQEIGKNSSRKDRVEEETF